MGIWQWTAVGFFVAMMVFALWTMHRMNRMFPKGTRVGNSDERKPDFFRWVGFWHRGGSGP